MTQPTLILVHGAFATSFSFAPLQAELAFHGVRSAAVDLPGHGFAATFPLGYQAPQDLARFTSEPGSIRGVTVDDNVRALTEAAARAKEHGPVVIVAHSRGGATLTALANAHPELIDHMVYVSAWAPVDLPAAEYNAEPEMKTVDNAALARALAGDPGQLGLLRCNFRQADLEVLAGLKALFCADVSDDEFRIFLNSLQPDENLDAGGPEHRAQAGTWGTIPRTFVRLGEDRSQPTAMQDRLIREGDALTPHNPYRVRTLTSSHVGWLIRPAEAAMQMAQIAADVAAESDR